MKLKLKDGTEFEGNVEEYREYIATIKPAKEEKVKKFELTYVMPKPKEVKGLEPLDYSRKNKKSIHIKKRFNITAEQKLQMIDNLDKSVPIIAKIIDAPVIAFYKYVERNGGIKRLRKKYGHKEYVKRKVKPNELKRMSFIGKKAAEYIKNYNMSRSVACKYAVNDWNNLKQEMNK